MTMSVSVRELLRDSHPFRKHSLAVHGLLVAKPGNCRVFDDEGAVDDRGRAQVDRNWFPDADLIAPEEVSIRIDDPTFLPRLLAEIPPVEDAEYLYFDTATVCGCCRFDRGEVVLEGIWSVFLVRGGKSQKALDHRITLG